MPPVGRQWTMSLPPDAAPPADPPGPFEQPRNPLHGLTLETLLTDLVNHLGWQELSRLVPLRCFMDAPSITSSLKMLRKTPWAREKVEGLYLYMLREQRREDAQAKRSQDRSS
jgi:uncharacterized protein (DUF2132 family)